MKRSLKWIAIGIGGLCILTFILTLVFPGDSPPADLSPTEQIQTAAADFLTANAPTATHTPLPTNTPEPSSQFGPEELAYLQAVFPAYGSLGDGFIRLGERIEEMAEYPAVLFNQEWLNEVSLILAEILIYANTLSSVTDVPPRFTELHATIVLLADETRLMVANFASAIDSLDTAYVEAFTENIDNMDGYITQISLILDSLPDSP